MTPTQPTAPTDVTGRLVAVRRAIADTGAACGRDSSAVTLVAVSKTHPAEAVAEALAAGQRVFGENRVQEAKGKFPDLKADFPDLERRGFDLSAGLARVTKLAHTYAECSPGELFGIVGSSG